ncbi:MAG TPA: hypothetical protein VFX70_14675 [Mycobacteriales bacterium]|nr:hypothetical protein [Mycobacteriales bacterium]
MVDGEDRDYRSVPRLLDRVSARPFLLAVAGLVVVLLDVRIGFFDLLPDACGYAAVAYALTRPALTRPAPAGRGQHRGQDVVAARVAALVGMGASVPELVSIGWNYQSGRLLLSGGSWSINAFGQVLDLVETLAAAAVVFLLCRVLARLAAARGLPELARYADQYGPWTPIPLLLSALLGVVVLVGGQPAPNVVAALVQLGVYAAFAAPIVFLAWADHRTGRPG